MNRAASAISQIRLPPKSAKGIYMDHLEKFIKAFSHKRTPKLSPIFDIDYRKYGISFMQREIQNANPEDVQKAVDLAYDLVDVLKENGYEKSKSES